MPRHTPPLQRVVSEGKPIQYDTAGHQQAGCSYAKAQQLVSAIRGLAPEVLQAAATNRRRGRWGLPPCTPPLLEAMRAHLPANMTPQGMRARINDAWRYVAMVERFPGLAPPITYRRVRAIELLLVRVPESKHEAILPALLRDSMQTLRNRYQEARRQARKQPRRPYRPRAPKATKATGAYWYERMVELRQGLLFLKEEGLIENLVRAWTPQNRHGYAAEVRHVIGELTSMLAKMERVIEEEDSPRTGGGGL
jgi:hypothetical protein